MTDVGAAGACLIINIPTNERNCSSVSTAGVKSPPLPLNVRGDESSDTESGYKDSLETNCDHNTARLLIDYFFIIKKN